MSEKLLEVKNLRTEFKRDKTWVTAVNNVSFSINKGEILGLVGESGCGKSVTSLSVMRLLARNSKISSGEVILNGHDLLKEDKKGMRKVRGREVAMIFQEPMNSLNPCMRIETQLTEAILLHNDFSKEQAHQRAVDVLKSVGIPEPEMTLRSYPHQPFRRYVPACYDRYGDVLRAGASYRGRAAPPLLTLPSRLRSWS